MGAIACKVSHILSSCSPPRARKILVQLFDDFVGWPAHQTAFSLACISDSDSEIVLAALQIVIVIVGTAVVLVHKGVVLTPINFRYIDGWLDLGRILSRFRFLLVRVAGCHHDVTRCSTYCFATTSGISI